MTKLYTILLLFYAYNLTAIILRKLSLSRAKRGVIMNTENLFVSPNKLIEEPFHCSGP